MNSISKIPLTIIFVNYNSSKDLHICISSLLFQTYKEFRIIIVDNSINLQEFTRLQEIVKNFNSLNINLFKMTYNLGFTGGNNFALKLIDSPYYLLLNCDTILNSDSIEKVMNYFETHPDIGIMSPKLRYYHPRNRIYCAGAEINVRTLKLNIIRGIGEVDKGQYELIEDTGYVSGAALFIKKQVIEKIGLLDEIFFCYCEETDWCIRAKQNGFRVIYYPNTIIYHNVKFSKFSSLTHGFRQNKFVSYLTNRNLIILMLKSFSLLDLPFILLHAGIELLLAFMTKNAFLVVNQIRAIFFGFFLGIRRKTNHRINKWLKSEYNYFTNLNPISSSQLKRKQQ